MATLSTHHPTNVKEKIMLKGFGSSGNDFTVEMLFLKYLVYVRPVAMHLLGKPFHRPPLFVENRFDNMSYMKILHQYVQMKIVNFMSFATEVLEYPYNK